MKQELQQLEAMVASLERKLAAAEAAQTPPAQRRRALRLQRGDRSRPAASPAHLYRRRDSGTASGER